MVSSFVHTISERGVSIRVSGNSDGEMENVYTVGQDLFDAPSAWHPADVSFSTDNTLLDVYLPDTSTIVTYKVDDIYTGETYVGTGGTTESSCLYMGTTSHDLLIVVDASTLYRFERTGEGALSAIDNVTIEQGTVMASSATADPTGDWVVIMVYQTLYSYYVGDETIELSQTVVGDAAIEDSKFIEITPDSKSVYLASNGNSGLAYNDATVNVSTGHFFLGSTFTTQTTWETDFVAVHPDGTRLYAGEKSYGKIRDYVRDPLDGSLDEPCIDVNDINLVANRMLVSPNGMYLYVSHRR
ncbi:unnamed protein product [Ectocarpus sp. 13 AM-2016]